MLILACLAALSCLSEAILIQTQHGQLEGEVLNLDGFEADVFRRIPFAQPPLRELRFKKPQPLKEWKGVKKAVKFAHRCIQFQPFGPAVSEEYSSEDCLYLNIFAPHIKDDAKFPVLVFIHGGSFTAGSAIEFGADGIITNFASKGLVVVTLQYRLGPWGFLSSGTEGLAGSWGLWDLVAGLEFVRDNIELVGGDPGRVTLAGQSAGAASSSMLSLTESAKGLFHQQILMSGGVLNMVGKHHLSVQYTNALAEILACDIPSAAQMADCMRTRETEEISEALTKMKITNHHQFLPAPDGDLFESSFENLLDNSYPIPTIMGTAENEFLLLPMLMTPNGMPYAQFKKELNEMITDTEYYNAPLIRRLLFHKYLHSSGDKKDETFLAKQFAQLASDFEMYARHYKEALQRNKNGAPVWLYSFEHFNGDAFPKSITDQEKAAYHSLDLIYLFRTNPLPKFIPNFQFSTGDEKVSYFLATLWTNFVKFGDPTPNNTPLAWPSINESHETDYLRISTDSQMSRGYRRAAVSFWNDLIPDIESFDKFSKKSGEFIPKAEPKTEEVDDDAEWRIEL